MIKRLAFLALLSCSTANAQFLTGQILTAQQLNSAFANVLPITGGTLTGPLTVPSLSVTGIVNLADVNITGGTISGLTAPLAVSSGGTGSASASGSALDHITGFAGTGFLTRTGAGTYAFQSTTNGITLGNIAQIGANTVLGNVTGSSASPAAIAMPSCSATGSALNWTTSTGISCQTGLAALNAPSFTGGVGIAGGLSISTGGASIAAGGLSVTGNVSGTGFSNYLASPPAIGGTAPAAGSFTTITANSMSRVIASTTNAMSIPNNSATTITTWTAALNTGTNFTASTGVYTAPVTGQYEVSAAFRATSASLGAATQFIVIVVVNGVSTIQAGSTYPATGTAAAQAHISGIVSATAGQTIVVQVFQTSGATLTLDGSAASNWLSINRLY